MGNSRMYWREVEGFFTGEHLFYLEARNLNLLRVKMWEGSGVIYHVSSQQRFYLSLSKDKATCYAG